MIVKPVHAQLFPVWKTIRCGIYHSAPTIRRVLEANNTCIDSCASFVIKDMKLSEKPYSLELYCATNSELDLPTSSISIAAVHSRIYELGYIPVPAETGLYLFLQHRIKATEEPLITIMEQLPDRGHCLDSFIIGRRSDKPVLNVVDHVVYGGYRFVFTSLQGRREDNNVVRPFFVRSVRI